MDGFTTYRRDRNINSGGIILYIRDDIPSTLLNIEGSIEGLHVKINVRRKKWLIGCSHNPNKTFISVHLKEIGKNLGVYSSKYDNFILLGDLNSEPKEQSVEDFCQVCNCKNVIKGNTCFKNPANSCCIDLLITNRPACFQGSMIKETGLSDFHEMSLLSRYGCISDASLRRLVQRLRDISNRADLQISETSPGILIKDVSSEMSQRFLRFSQRRR